MNAPLKTMAAAVGARLWCVWMVAVFAVAQPAQADLTDEQIQQAISTLKSWLYEQQQEGGSWERRPDGYDGRYVGGETSLAALAMLYAGDSYQSEHGEHGGLAAALKWLNGREVWGAYTYAIRAHVWAALPDEFHRNLKADAEALVEHQRNGLFDYGTPPRPGRIDHSVTQYGVLGLWEYGKRGGVISDDFWQQVAGHFLASQRPDGGWNYEGQGDSRPSYGSMTAAGLTVLFVARQELMADGGKPDPRLNRAIERGLAWFNRHFSAQANPAAGQPHPHPYDRMYYWYGMERVALASGVKTFNGLDWYRTGAQAITSELLTQDMGRVRANTNIVDASFGLMFLVRGRVPVWCQKISLPNAEWNSRPDDMATITSHLSDRFEQRLNWSLTDGHDPLALWLQGPMAWLSTADGLNALDETTQRQMDAYINHGGLVVINPEGKPLARQQLAEYAKTHFPGATVKQVEDNHPLLSLVNQVKAGPGDKPYVLSQGARDLIVVLPDRWGTDFGRLFERGGAPVDILANLFATYTQRGQMPPRLVTRYVAPQGVGGDASRQFEAIRVTLSGNDHAVIEPEAWDTAAGPLEEQTGRLLTVTTVPLDQLKPGQGDLVHLAGTGAVALTDSELVALKSYIDAGGLVFAETLGGQGLVTEEGVSQFSRDLLVQIRKAWSLPAKPLPSNDRLVTGQGLGQGAEAFRTANWRDFSRLRFRFGPRQRLQQITPAGKDRPGLIVSHEDVSLGVMDVLHDPINGYTRETARQMLINLLWAGADRR